MFLILKPIDGLRIGEVPFIFEFVSLYYHPSNRMWQIGELNGPLNFLF